MASRNSILGTAFVAGALLTQADCASKPSGMAQLVTPKDQDEKVVLQDSMEADVKAVINEVITKANATGPDVCKISVPVTMPTKPSKELNLAAKISCPPPIGDIDLAMSCKGKPQWKGVEDPSTKTMHYDLNGCSEGGMKFTIKTADGKTLEVPMAVSLEQSLSALQALTMADSMVEGLVPGSVFPVIELARTHVTDTLNGIDPTQCTEVGSDTSTLDPNLPLDRVHTLQCPAPLGQVRTQVHCSAPQLEGDEVTGCEKGQLTRAISSSFGTVKITE